MILDPAVMARQTNCCATYNCHRVVALELCNTPLWTMDPLALAHCLLKVGLPFMTDSGRTHQQNLPLC